MAPVAGETTVLHRISQDVGGKSRGERGTLEFKIGMERAVIRYLDPISRGEESARADAAKALLAEHKPLLAALKTRKRRLDKEEGIQTQATENTIGSGVIRNDEGQLVRVDHVRSERVEDMQAEALRFELEQISLLREEGAISSAAAREMREEVYLLQMGLSEQ